MICEPSSFWASFALVDLLLIFPFIANTVFRLLTIHVIQNEHYIPISHTE